MPKYEYLTHGDMDSYYAEAIRKMTIDNFKPHVVFAPMRGGADFGIKVSNYFDIPFESIQWQTRDGSEKDITRLKELYTTYDGKNILIVDDICDSGETLRGIEHASGYNRTNIRFAVAIENIECSFACDYSAREISRTEDTQWFIFPWEKWW
jgi:hypoxanthine phosphoribosyltransferase